MIPDYLIDFIQNDPNFVPEIHCNNLEDVFFDIYQGPNDTSELEESKKGHKNMKST
jgi:hypothetical protein